MCDIFIACIYHHINESRNFFEVKGVQGMKSRLHHHLIRKKNLVVVIVIVGDLGCDFGDDLNIIIGNMHIFVFLILELFIVVRTSCKLENATALLFLTCLSRQMIL